MKTYVLSHLSDQTLLRDLAALVARDRATTAELLAHIAEVDARKLYLPAAHPSMFSYCVHELHLSEDAAYKRIQAARAARQFPAIFEAVAEGGLHLTGLGLLAPYLTRENADALLRAAAHRSKSAIEQHLARCFPRSEALALVEAIPGTRPWCDGQLAPAQVAAPRGKVAPTAPQRFSLHLTIGQSTHDKLRYAQALLSHQVPSDDVAQVLDRALDALIRRLEQRKFAATSRPRPGQRRATGAGRHIPAEVKRAVWERDQGQCTFVSEAGRRCPARTRLEFDHADPVARGGRASAARMRLRCRAHNQYEAERVFGTEFMSGKREETRRKAAACAAAKAAAARERATARARAEAAAAAAETSARDVIPWLRALGFRAEEARQAAARCETIPDAPLEERVRVALSYSLGRRPSFGPHRSAGGLRTTA